MAIEFKPVNRAVASAPAAPSSSAPATTAVLDTPESLLTSDVVKQNMPAQLWNEWNKGVQEKRRDYLFHLVSLAEIDSAPMKIISPTLKGLVLLLGGASSEAYALIESAPDSPWKTNLLTQFERRKP